MVTFTRRNNGEVMDASHLNELQVAVEQLDTDKASKAVLSGSINPETGVLVPSAVEAAVSVFGGPTGAQWSTALGTLDKVGPTTAGLDGQSLMKTAQGVKYVDDFIDIMDYANPADAVAAAKARGLQLRGKGTLALTTTLEIDCNADLRNLTVTVNDVNMTAIRIGKAAVNTTDITVYAPKIIQLGKAAATGGWTGTSIGLEIRNLQRSTIYTQEIKHFTDGIRATASGGRSSTEVKVVMTFINNCKRSIRIGAEDATSWVNEFSWYEGKLYHASPETQPTIGARKILIEATVQNVSSHKFYNLNIEDVGPAEYLVETYGQYCKWIECRWEANSGNKKVFFGGSSSPNATALYNEILGGLGADTIIFIEEGNARYNHLIAHDKQVVDGVQADGGILRVVNWHGATSPAITVGRGLNGFLSGPYMWGWGASRDKSIFKSWGDTTERMSIDHPTGQINWGAGTTLPADTSLLRGTSNRLTMGDGDAFRTGAVTSLPTANSTYRGYTLRVEGGAGTSDGYYVCEKSSNDSYYWRKLTSSTFNVKDFGATGIAGQDNTAAIQAAINAAQAFTSGSTTRSAIVEFPAGIYDCFGGLTVSTQGITFRGAGQYATWLRTTGGTADLVTLTSASKFRAESMRFHSTAGGGHIFKITNSLSYAMFIDIWCAQSNDNKSILWGDDTVTGTELNYIDNLWLHCETTHKQTATVAAFHLRGGAVNRNRWLSMRHTDSGNYVFLLETTAVSSYANDNTIDGINFEICTGGIVKALGAQGLVLRDIAIYDLSSSTTRDLIYLGNSTVGGILPTRAITLDNVRRNGFTLGAGLYDVNLQMSSSTPRLTIRSSGGSTSLFVNFNSKRALVEESNVTPTNGTLVTYIDSTGSTFPVKVTTPILELGSVQLLSGAGTPEGVQTAPVGSLYLRTDGGAGTTFYVKETGTGNTGWVAK